MKFIKILLVLVIIGISFSIYYLNHTSKSVTEFNAPEKIDDYNLVPIGGSPDKIDNISNDCSLTRTKDGTFGSLCSEGFRLIYESDQTNKIVFVKLNNITEGIDLVRSYVNPTTEGQKVFRLEKHEIIWFPKGEFNMVLVQEGTYSKTETDVDYAYKKEASLENPVTQYFLEKYPPTE